MLFLGSHINVSGLTEVSQDGKDYFVVGVILKRMKYRRSVLYEFTEDALDFEFREKIASDNLVAPDDYLELEDYQQVGFFITGNIQRTTQQRKFSENVSDHFHKQHKFSVILIFKFYYRSGRYNYISTSFCIDH